MRLRTKIRQLKEQHAQLRELKEAQQVQLASAAAGLHLEDCSCMSSHESTEIMPQEPASASDDNNDSCMGQLDQ